jgi:hypothetical protein
VVAHTTIPGLVRLKKEGLMEKAHLEELQDSSKQDEGIIY